MKRLILFLSVLPLAVFATDIGPSHFYRTNSLNGGIDAEPIRITQAEDVTLDQWTITSAGAVTLPTNTVPVWYLSARTNLSLVFIVSTGTLQGATSGWVQVGWTWQNTIVPATRYVASLRAYDSVGGTNRYIGTLAQHYVDVSSVPDTNGYTTVVPTDLSKTVTSNQMGSGAVWNGSQWTFGVVAGSVVGVTISGGDSFGATTNSSVVALTVNTNVPAETDPLSSTSKVSKTGDTMSGNLTGTTIYASSFNNLLNSNAAPYSSALAGSNNYSAAGSENSFIGGGFGNTIGPGSLDSFIGGGVLNRMQSNALACAILEGDENVIGQAQWSSILGGEYNSLGMSNSVDFSAIVGGAYNENDGFSSTITGGKNNFIGTMVYYGFAHGWKAKVTNTGSAVFGDSAKADKYSECDNSFNLVYSGGFWLNRTNIRTLIDGKLGTDTWAAADSTTNYVKKTDGVPLYVEVDAIGTAWASTNLTLIRQMNSATTGTIAQAQSTGATAYARADAAYWKTNLLPVASWSFLSAKTDATGEWKTVWSPKWYGHAIPLVEVGYWCDAGTATVELLSRDLAGVFTTLNVVNVNCATYSNVVAGGALAVSNMLGLRVQDGVSATSLYVGVNGWLP